MPEAVAGVTVRLAQEADRGALEHIAARTWEGSDYLPQVITDWLADTDGAFIVAVLDDERVVGTTKITRFGPGEWWLEGMRVDPDLHGQGIGTTLHRYAVQHIEARQETGIVRLCTDQNNQAVRKMCLETGFSETARFLRYQADIVPPQPETLNAFRAMTERDLGPIRSFLDVSAHYDSAQKSVIARRWIVQTITDDRLRGWLAAGQVLGWYGRRHDVEKLDGVVITAGIKLDQESRPELLVTYLDAMPGNLAALAHALRGFTSTLNARRLSHMLLVRPERLVAIEQAGWRRPQDNRGRAALYAKTLSGN